MSHHLRGKWPPRKRPSAFSHRSRTLMAAFQEQMIRSVSLSYDLEHCVVAVLLREESARVFEAFFGPEQAFLLETTARHVNPGRLVVFCATRSRAQVAAECNEAYRVPIFHIKRPNRVEFLQLVVQRIPAILGGQQLALVGERKVVERVRYLVAENEERDRAAFVLPAVIIMIVIVVTKINAENRAPGATRCQLRNLAGGRVRIAGRTKVEGPEA